MVAINYLITEDGKFYYTGGVQHNIYIRLHFKTTLKRFLRDGGVRVKVYNDHMAVEAGRSLTVEQKRWITKTLRKRDYFSLVVSISGKYAVKERFRAIRSI